MYKIKAQAARGALADAVIRMSPDYGTGMPTWPGTLVANGRPATYDIGPSDWEDRAQLALGASHENLAQAGIALTLFPHQIPEVSRLVWTQEYLVQKLELD